MTLPTTTYRTKRSLPRNLLPADYYSVSPQHAHLPLVFMLVLTQMSVGAVLVDQILNWFPMSGDANANAGARAVQCLASFVLGVMGLLAATLHLGRPLYAFGAFLGLRTSWLSREILAFGIFAFLATVYAAQPWIVPTASWKFRQLLGGMVALSGIIGVICSVMIYVSTRRPFWSAPLTSLKFFLTCAVLGIPTALLIWILASRWYDSLAVQQLMMDFGGSLCVLLAILSGVKLLSEAAIFLWLPTQRFTPLKRTALLLVGELGPTTLQRFAMGIAGGVVLPLTVALPYLQGSTAGHNPLFILSAVGLSLVLLLVGELLERYTFFAAVVAPKMPGALVA